MNAKNLVPLFDWMEFLASKITDRFKSKVSIFTETEHYVLKTAETAFDLEMVLKLRHEVFLKELQNKRNFFKIELDRLDLKCDHLLIIDKQTEAVVGCYRLISSHFIKNFYSENEFDLSRFLDRESDPKLELGRACILPSHRNGMVIQLLWRGITAYMKKTDTRFLMGCSSVQTLDPAAISALIQKVEDEGLVDDQYFIRPTFKYHPLNHGVSVVPKNKIDEASPIELPPLILSYLKAGAKLAPFPAVDQDFNCIDFFTLLDRENMHPLFLRRYFGH